MADTSTEGQGPAVPDLVEILKRLAAHQRKMWEETFCLEEIAKRFIESLKADDRDAAANRLRRFVVAAGVECSDESRRQMLANLDRVMAARRAAQASGDSKFNAFPADLGSEAEKAFGVLGRIGEEGLLKEKTDAYWRHPLLQACAWLEERLGIGRDLLEIAAGRLTSALGLRVMEPLRGPNGKTSEGAPDWLWMIPKFREADRDGTTAKLWRMLLDEYPAELIEAGLAPGADSPTLPDTETGEGEENEESSPQVEPLITIEKWADLGIGIDEHSQYLAVAPRPEFGDVFPRKKAVALHLPGKRWKEVLNLLACSENGNTARKKDLMQGLGYLKAADIPAGELDELKQDKGKMTVLKKTSSRLTNTIADLGRKLREQVKGPECKGGGAVLSVAQEGEVRAAFVVRYLAPGVDGKLRFGEDRD